MPGFNIPPTAVGRKLSRGEPKAVPGAGPSCKECLFPQYSIRVEQFSQRSWCTLKGRAAAFDLHAPENRSSADMRLSRLLLLALAAYGVYAQSSLPRAPGAHVVTISPPNSHGSEPGICVNPNDSNQVVAVYQPATVAYSADGGQTFTLAELPPVPGWQGGGDVSTTFDNKGHVYLSSLHFDNLGSASYWAHGAGRNGIFVRRSLDGGQTWEKDAATVKAYEGNEPDIQWEDMPRIFAENVPTMPYAWDLYAGWLE